MIQGTESHIFANQRGGATYVAQIAAVNDIGEGLLSLPLRFTQLDGNPGPVQDLRLEDVTFSSLRVSWSLPVYSGVDPATFGLRRYTVSVYLGHGDPAASTIVETQLGDYQQDQTTYTETISGLDQGTAYTIVITSVNTAGESSPLNDPPFLRVRILSPEPLGVPGTPSTTMLTHNSITVRWEAAIGGGIVDRFRLYWSLKNPNAGDDSSESSLTVGVGPTLTKTITDLLVNRAYSITVRAESERPSTVSGRSNELEARTYALSEPTGIIITPQDGSLQVDWSAPETINLAIRGYRVYWAPANSLGQTNSGEMLLPSTPTSYTITSLANGDPYSVEVAATSDDGREAARSAPKIGTPRTTPGAPQSLTTTEVTFNSITVSWLAPDNGGDPITHYEISWVDQSDDDMSGSATTTGMSYTITPLNPATEYQITVVAVNGAGSSTTTELQDVLTPETVPGVPEIMLMDVTLTSIEVRWTTPANGGATITTYNIYHSAGENVEAEMTPISVEGSATSHVLDDLMSGTVYTVAVTAENANGQSSLSEAESTRTIMSVPPRTPISLSIPADADREPTRIAITWDAPTEANDVGMITYYEIYWRIQDDPDASRSTERVAGSLRSFTIPNLSPNTTYTITIAAINDAGTGAISMPGEAVTSPPTGPDAPTALSITGVTFNSITVSWVAPDNGGAPITSYQIFWRITDLSLPSSDTTVPSTQTSFTIENLNFNTIYTITVVAANSVGPGDSSSLDGTGAIVTEASAPRDLRDSGITSRSIRVSWLAPDNGGAPITGYQISWTVLNSGSTPTVTITTATSYEITDLAPASSYQIAVVALNIVGSSEPTILNLSTTVGPPGAPVILPVTEITTNSFTVNWRAPDEDGGVPITGYFLRVDSNGISVEPLTLLLDNQTSYTVTNIDPLIIPGDLYNIQLGARNSEGIGVGAEVNVRTLPNAPTGLKSDGVTDNSIRVIWSTQGARVTYYEISWVNVSDGVMSGATTTTATSYEITDLDPATQYQITVRAVNNSGRSVAEQLNQVTNAGVPDAPQSLATTEVTFNSIAVSWDVPAADGGAMVTTYGITLRNRDDRDRLVGDRMTTKTSFTLRDLKPATRYSIEVVAINSVGSSVSTRLMVRTPETTPGPGSLEELSVGRVTTNSITVFWRSDPEDDGGTDILEYEISWSTGGEFVSSNRVSETLNTYQIGSDPSQALNPGTLYQIEVSAINRIGPGPAQSIMRLTAVASPSAPRELEILDVTDSSIAVSWDAPADTGGRAITSYFVFVSGDSGSGIDLRVQLGPTARSTQIINLAPGTGYQISVYALNDGSMGFNFNIATTSARTAMREPDAPTNLRPLLIRSNRIEVIWDAPGEDGGTPVTIYRVSWVDPSTNGISGMANVDAFSRIRYLIENLDRETLYNIEVVAINSVGKSSTASISISTRGTPDAPTELTTTAVTVNSITVSWVAPTETGGFPIVGYRIVWTGPANVSSGTADTQGPETRYTITGLTPETVYEIEVSALNINGESSTVSISVRTPRAPGAPTGLSVIAVTADSIEVNWVAPTDPGESPITSYRIVWTDTSIDGAPGMASTTRTSYTIMGLAPGTVYTIEVYTQNSDGFSTEPGELSQVTNVRVPDAPMNLRPTAITFDSITVSWDDPAEDGGTPITTYRISWVDDPDTGGTLGPVTTTGMSYTITGLEIVTNYRIAVAAGNRVGFGAVAELNTRTNAVAPEAPVLTVGNATLYTIEVMWTVPTSNGATITAFNVYHSVGENVDLAAVTPPITPISVPFDARAGMPTNYRLTNLMPSTVYTVAVSAVNAIDEGPLSEADTMRTITSVVPSQPLNVTGPVVPEATRIAITWDAPAPAVDNNVGTITDYEIYWRTTNNLNLPSRSSRVDGSLRSFTIVDLNPNTAYYITVAAINDAGTSALSDVLESQTETAAPEAPQSLVVTDRTLTSIEVAWQAPLDDNGEEVTAYQVFYKTGVSTGEATQSGGDISSSSTLRHRIIELDSRNALSDFG